MAKLRLCRGLFVTVVASLLTILAGAGQATAAAAPAPCSVVTAANLADKFWIASGPGQAAGNWQNATFNVANLHLVALTGKANHYSLPWAQKLKWAVSTKGGATFPDNFAVGEAYVDVRRAHKGGGVNLGPITARVSSLAAGGNAGVETYADALNMNLPVAAQLGVMNKSQADLTFVHNAYTFAEKTQGLFDPTTGLWWRDASAKRANVSLSRSNGFAMAATAKLLTELPANDPLRPELVSVLQSMAAGLKTVQRSDGAWGADLRDPADAPGPEESGTALFTFAIAWGINNKVLDAATYRPVVQNAWRWLSGTALHANGLVGFVQPEGTVPATTTSTTTRAYGAGAFILAATEVARLTAGC
jgi:hypothetical protein